MHDRYLMLIAILTVLLNIVSLSGDLIFGKLLVDQTMPAEDLDSGASRRHSLR
jgi:hypothetical protein